MNNDDSWVSAWSIRLLMIIEAAAFEATNTVDRGTTGRGGWSSDDEVSGDEAGASGAYTRLDRIGVGTSGGSRAAKAS